MSEPLNDLLDRELRHRLNKGQVMGCQCMTKTPIAEYHDEVCRYRLCVEALAKIDQYQDAMVILQVELESLQAELSAANKEISWRKVVIANMTDAARDHSASVKVFMETREDNERLREESKWISVDDRLPEEFGYYLVIAGPRDIVDASCEPYGACGDDDAEFRFSPDVTHWMVLSPPLIDKEQS